jgi:hypothetical protein
MTVLISEEQLVSLAKRRRYSILKEKLDDVLKNIPQYYVCQSSPKNFVQMIVNITLANENEDYTEIVELFRDDILNSYYEKKKDCKSSLFSKVFGQISL